MRATRVRITYKATTIRINQIQIQTAKKTTQREEKIGIAITEKNISKMRLQNILNETQLNRIILVIVLTQLLLRVLPHGLTRFILICRVYTHLWFRTDR